MTGPANTLLYATDLSDGSAYALGYALRMADSLDARLHVLHVLEPLSDEARLTIRSFMSDPAAQDRARHGRKQMALERMRDRQAEFWKTAGPEMAALEPRLATSEVIEGFPAEVILNRARSLPADLILMGSHEHGLSHTFLGQVAKRVLRRSRLPTLIIPYPEDD